MERTSKSSAKVLDDIPPPGDAEKVDAIGASTGVFGPKGGTGEEQDAVKQFSPRNCFQLGIFVVFMTAICIVLLAVVIIIPIMNKFS